MRYTCLLPKFLTNMMKDNDHTEAVNKAGVSVETVAYKIKDY
jgi:hypothetical protein